MKKRYKTDSDGTKAVANIYMTGEHPVDKTKIDKNAISIIVKLQKYGFESYLVGGAVRDLMQGRIPKDFDIATAASPRQVHRIFQNSRIIGRRFKLVHITVDNKIYEVSTFRSLVDSEDEGNNVFGTIDEDAKRRDFSINSLYYNPEDNTVLDFNNSFADFRRKKITSLIPLSYTFKEDPVRMIRAVKYSHTTGFALRRNIVHAIKRDSRLLSKVSISRLTEELNKILACGESCNIFKTMQKYKLLVYLLPNFSLYTAFPQVTESLRILDDKVNSDRANGIATPKSEMYLALAKPLLVANPEITTPSEKFKDYFRQFKVLLSPNTPPNFDIEEAVIAYMKDSGIRVPKRQMQKNTREKEKKTMAQKAYPKKRSALEKSSRPNLNIKSNS